MSPEIMADISQTYLDSNRHMVQSLSSQKADLAVGLILIFLAFLASLVSFICTMESPEGRSVGVVVVGAIILGAFALYINGCLETKFEEQTEAILKGSGAE